MKTHLLDRNVVCV
uniref:Uncharacterized protein n=1 Tax=Anguilla anguilla TaxID=7936 RepID=A0A0E9T3U6_ANGAN